MGNMPDKITIDQLPSSVNDEYINRLKRDDPLFVERGPKHENICSIKSSYVDQIERLLNSSPFTKTYSHFTEPPTTTNDSFKTAILPFSLDPDTVEHPALKTLGQTLISLQEMHEKVTTEVARLKKG